MADGSTYNSAAPLVSDQNPPMAPVEFLSGGRVLTQLELAWDSIAPSIDLENPSAARLSDQPLKQDQSQRVLQLEQALEQCQLYIDELKAQLVEQKFLEEVLAKTEEASQVQQQAINSLKQQLAHQDILEAQVEELTKNKISFETTIAAAEAKAAADKLELVKLQANLRQAEELQRSAQTIFDQRIAELQAQINQKDNDLKGLHTQLAQAEELTQKRTDQLATLKSRAHKLEADLQEQRQYLSETESHLQRTKEIVAAQQELIHTLQQAGNSDGSKNKVLQNMSKTLLQSQNKIEALEATLANQRLAHAKLQHHTQELEDGSSTDQKRINQLEQQVAEMQEQILHQAQQSHEFETAVQHWKDRGTNAEQSLSQLKQIIEQLVTDRQLAELELALSGQVTDDESLTESDRLLRGLKLTLPSFFSLRRDNLKASS
jgi:chromosome segregation ATPase